MIFELLVSRNTPSIRETFAETFAETFGLLRQMVYVPRPCPNMARKYGILSPKVVIMVLNRKLLPLGILSAAI